VWGCRRQLSITACLKGSCCFPSIFRGCCPRHTTSMVHLMVKQGHMDASCHTKFVIGVEVIPRHWQRSLDGYTLPRRRTNVRVLRKQNAGTQCSSRGGTCDGGDARVQFDIGPRASSPRSTSPQLSPQQQLVGAPRRVFPALFRLQLGEKSSPCPPSSCAFDQHVLLPAIHAIEEHLLLPRLAALTTFAL
jgi:hypothetical protein